MDRWKKLALGAYYYGSYAYRSWSNHSRAKQGMAPVAVLYYHRVADDGASLWTLSNRRFEKQIKWLQSRFDLVSLEEAQRRIRSRDNRHPAVCITFDDGYSDNCRYALPLLVKLGIPCTYFVSTQNVLGGEPFAHDVRLGISSPPNTLEQLTAIAAAGIEIGAHTRSHADLGSIKDAAVLRDEVVVAGEELQSALQRPVRYFAFPFGQYRHLNAEVFHLAYEAGYEAVCSAYGGFNFPGDDAFHLQRIAVDDEMLRLKNWLTIDPRKRHTPRFEYGSVRPVTDAVGVHPT